MCGWGGQTYNLLMSSSFGIPYAKMVKIGSFWLSYSKNKNVSVFGTQCTTHRNRELFKEGNNYKSVGRRGAHFERYLFLFNEWQSASLHFVPCLLNICRKFEFLISQRTVATCVRWDRHCRMDFAAEFIRFLVVQKFWKSVKILQTHREFKMGTFWDTA